MLANITYISRAYCITNINTFYFASCQGNGTSQDCAGINLNYRSFL